MSTKKTLGYIITCILLVVTVFSNAPTVSHGATGDLGEGYNIANFAESFTTIDDETFSTSSNDKATVLVFARTNGNCPNSNGVVWDLNESNWIYDENVRVAIIDIDKASKETVAQMQESFPSSGLTYCYCEDNSANNAMWSYLEMTVGESSSVTLPVTIIIDKNDKIQYCMTGYRSSNEIYAYTKNVVGEELSDENNPNEFDLYLEGTFDEEQAFEVLEIVNDTRENLGLNPLIMDSTLMDAAMQRAAECAVYYSHTRPNGKLCFSILDDTYKNGCGENIAAGYTSADDVMNGWLNSEGHYANIVGESYNSIGIGCFYQDGALYWVQLFSSYEGDETLQPENYKTMAQIQTLTDNVSSITLEYPSNIKANTTAKPLKLRGNNLGFDGNSYELAPQTFAFTTDNTKIATIDEDGVLHALAPGSTSVTATVKDKISAKCDVTIIETGLEVGDVDFDGDVDLKDAQLTLRFALLLYIPYELEALVADMNYDEQVTLEDAQRVLRRALLLD